MNCEEARARWIEQGAPDAGRLESESHAADCADCAAWLEQQQIVGGWLQELSQTMGAPAPELESKLRTRFRARAKPPSPAPWAWAAAAVLAAGVGFGAWVSRIEPHRPAPPAIRVEEPSPFVLLDYGRPTRELTAGRLVRVTLPPSAPAWFGLPVDPAAREGIEAEVLLGDDGVAQAVRLVSTR